MRGAWARWELPALLAVLALALLLRFDGYTQAPLLSDNQDEMDWAWMGLGLITQGVPYGWTNHTAYPDGVRLRANGTQYVIVHPFLDHPPVFGILVGGAAWLAGARELTDVKVDMIRPVPILCGVLAILLLYLLARRLLGPPAAMAGIVLLATSPAAVLMQRQVEAESLLAPILLGAILLMLRILDGRAGRWTTAGLLGLCLVAPLVKVSGVAVAGVAATVLLTSGRWRLATATLAAGVAGLGLYLLYGALFDWQLFTRILGQSDNRRYGVLGLSEFIAAPAGPSGVNHHLRDGWWLLGWLGLGWLLTRGRDIRTQLLVWPALGYGLVMMVFGERLQDYGWFRLTLYPIVYAMAGWIAWEAVRRPSATALLAVLALGTTTATSALLQGGNSATRAAYAGSWVPSAYLLVFITVVFVGPAILAAWHQGQPLMAKLARYTGELALALTVAANVATSLNLATVYTHL